MTDDNLMESMPDRVYTVIKAKEGHTKYKEILKVEKIFLLQSENNL